MNEDEMMESLGYFDGVMFFFELHEVERMDELANKVMLYIYNHMDEVEKELVKPGDDPDYKKGYFHGFKDAYEDEYF